MRAFLIGLVVLTCACTSSPPVQEHRAHCEFGTAHADAPEKAAALARVLVEVAPRVRALLPDCSASPVEIHLVQRLDSLSWGGVTMHFGNHRWIELPDQEFDSRFRATLAHELVHYWLGPTWRTLPGKLEEGLANWIGALAEPEYLPAEAGWAFLQLTTLVQGGYTVEWEPKSRSGMSSNGAVTIKLRLAVPYDAETLPAIPGLLSGRSPIHDTGMPRSNRSVFDSVAFLVVSRAGVDTLNTLCRRAAYENRPEVPASWLLEAARLDDSSLAAWKPAVDALLSPEARAWLIERASMQQIERGSGPTAASSELE